MAAMESDKMEKRVYKLVLTGGKSQPCTIISAKSTDYIYDVD